MTGRHDGCRLLRGKVSGGWGDELPELAERAITGAVARIRADAKRLLVDRGEWLWVMLAGLLEMI